MFNAKVVAGLSGLPHHAIRQMSHRGIMRPQGPKKTWTKNQTLGLCAMRHARLAGASMSAAVGAYEILSRANWDALRAACAVGKHYLRIFGETVEMQTVTHRAAFAQKIIQAATQQ